MSENVANSLAKQGKENNMEDNHCHEQGFPVRLHGLLEMLEQDGLAHICSFQPHGRAFMVHDKKRFVKELLPKWFRQNHWTSFQRQLNIYEFKRITKGRDRGAYYHPRFIKDRRDLCVLMKRVRLKGNGGRKPACPEAEPDFYSSTLTPTTAEPDSAGTTTSPPEGRDYLSESVASGQRRDVMALSMSSSEARYRSTMPRLGNFDVADIPSFSLPLALRTTLRSEFSSVRLASTVSSSSTAAASSDVGALVSLANSLDAQIIRLGASILKEEVAMRQQRLQRSLTNELAMHKLLLQASATYPCDAMTSPLTGIQHGSGIGSTRTAHALDSVPESANENLSQDRLLLQALTRSLFK